MPKPIGPTIPRWQLGERLKQLRATAGLSLAAVAERLGCSPSKVTKIEAGLVSVIRAELEVMLRLYDADETAVSELVQLQRLGKQRGWWAKHGRVPQTFAVLLGMESAAATIKIFEPLIIPGLVQTEAYARTVSRLVSMDPTDAETERQVRLRLERQHHVLNVDPPALSLVLDESALRRVIGDCVIMADQLSHLASMAERYSVLVVPLERAGHPGSLGAFTIFEFLDGQHSPVVYVEGQAGNLYLERSEDLARCNLAYDYMTEVALDRSESAALIARIAGEMSDVVRKGK